MLLEKEAKQQRPLRQPIARLDAASKQVMTASRLAAVIAGGAGSGRYELYSPWIRIRRRASSPVSNQFYVPIASQPRMVHLLAGTEYYRALLADYLGALEIREQFPLFLEPHQHPGIDPTRRYPMQIRDRLIPGIVEIARTAGIDPGRYPGSNVTYVPSTDLFLLVRSGDAFGLVSWAVKPHALLVGAGSSRRLERLELERRYAHEVGCLAFRVLGGDEAPKLMLHNLDAYMPLPRELRQWKYDARLQVFAQSFEVDTEGRTLHELVIRSAQRTGVVQRPEAFAMFRTAAWMGLIDVNMSKPVMWRAPATRGGKELRVLLRQSLFGVAQ